MDETLLLIVVGILAGEKQLESIYLDMSNLGQRKCLDKRGHNLGRY